jgi:hypothetical protein
MNSHFAPLLDKEGLGVVAFRRGAALARPVGNGNNAGYCNRADPTAGLKGKPTPLQ